MKKIIYIISTLKKGGPTNILTNIILNLDKKQFKPIIVTLSKEDNISNSYLFELKKQNIEIYTLGLTRIQSLFFTKNKLCDIINKIKPDIIHCHCFRSTIFTALFLNNFTKFVTIHCDFDIDFAMIYGKIKGIIMSKLYFYALKHFDKRIAVSKLLADILNKRHKHLNCDHIDNGIDTNIFKPIENKVEIRKKLNLPLDKKIFIWCGLFIDRKNPQLLTATIKQLKDKSLFFVFCGDGKLLNNCKKETKNYKNILFTGYTNNIKEYFQASDFYISTSISEGFHLTTYEAMSCGLPVLLANIPIYTELQEYNIGLFFQSKSINDLNYKINKLVNINYNLYSNNSVNLIKNRFSAKLMSYKYHDAYMSI